MSEQDFKRFYIGLSARFGGDTLAVEGYIEELSQKAKIALSERYSAKYRTEAAVCRYYVKHGPDKMTEAWQDFVENFILTAA